MAAVCSRSPDGKSIAVTEPSPIVHALFGHGWGPPVCQVPPLSPEREAQITCPDCARILILLRTVQVAS